MSDDLQNQPVNYKHTPPDTPYQRAAQEWDDRIGSARVQAKNWRMACLVSLIITLVLAVMAIMLLDHSKPKVFVAQLGTQGQVMNVAPLQERYNPGTAQYQYILGQFIHKTMTLSLDPQVTKDNWQSSYAMVAGKAVQQLNQLAKQSMLNQSTGKMTKTVSIQSIQQITPNSYEGKWQQNVIDRNGKILQTRYYSGVFTITHKQPQTQQEILQNPLGIQILYFTLQESK